MSANLDRLARVASAARPLLERFVFVGGAVAELYFTDPASQRVRPTRDADAVVEAATYTAYGRLSKTLRELGFRQSADENDPIYRWRLGNDLLDVMPLDPDVLGFTNPWYAEGVRRAIDVELSKDLVIRVFPPPLALASKLAAYEDRGQDDPYVSRDLEDVVALLANRPEIVREVIEEEEELRRWIAEHLRAALGTPEARPALQANLPELAWTPGLQELVADRIRVLTEPRQGDADDSPPKGL